MGCLSQGSPFFLLLVLQFIQAKRHHFMRPLTLHLNLDQSQLIELGQLNNALAGLNAEREILEKISTLPWRMAMLTGFLSATVLPVILLLVQIAIEQWLGK